MRTGKLLAVAAGVAFLLAPALAQAGCAGHTKSVKMNSQTVHVESSKPVAKPDDKKS